MKQRSVAVGMLDLERLRYRQGQLLRTCDFHQQSITESQLRWWHNRALHNVFGAADGFRVEIRAGQNLAVVGPGLAFDCYGRELMLVSSAEVPLPPRPDPSNQWTLFISSSEASHSADPRGTAGACLPGKAASAAGRMNLFWAAADTRDFTDAVPLGTLSYDPNNGWKFATRYSARPQARPRIGSGSTIPGHTNWKRWQIPQNELPFLGFETAVDTCTTGFTEVPCYFAWLEGVPRLDAGRNNIVPVLMSQHIVEATIRGFRFRFLTLLPQRMRLEVAPEGISVCWLGIQHEPRKHIRYAASEVTNGHCG